MNRPRKADARPSIRYPALRRAARAWDRLALPAACVVVVFVLLWKWHLTAADAAIRVNEPEAPTLVLVVQEGDCPDRRGTLEEWLEAVHGSGGWPGVDLRVASFGEAAVPRDSRLRDFAALGPDATGRAARAFERFGVEGTPGLLLLDEHGYPVLGASFATSGLGPRFHAVARVLESLESLASPGGEPSDEEADRWSS